MELSDSAARVQAVLAEAGFAFEVREFDKSTRTSADAAATIGCAVAQIAKSLVFRGLDSGAAVLVMASGANRVDLMRLGEIWAAAGTLFAVFRLTPAALVEQTGGIVGEVAEKPG